MGPRLRQNTAKLPIFSTLDELLRSHPDLQICLNGKPLRKDVKTVHETKAEATDKVDRHNTRRNATRQVSAKLVDDKQDSDESRSRRLVTKKTVESRPANTRQARNSPQGRATRSDPKPTKGRMKTKKADYFETNGYVDETIIYSLEEIGQRLELETLPSTPESLCLPFTVILDQLEANEKQREELLV